MASLPTARRYRGAILAAAAFLAPPLGLIAPLGEAPLFAVAAILLAVPMIRERRIPVPPRPWGAIFTGLAALALLSCLWSIDLSLSLDRSVRLVGEIAFGFVLIASARTLDAQAKNRLGLALACGILLTVLLILGDFAVGHLMFKLVKAKSPTLNHLDRGVTTLAVLVWPAALLLRASGLRMLMLIVLAAVLVATLAMKSDSSKVGLLFASLAAAAIWWQPRLTGATLRIAVPLLVVILPLGALALPPPERLMEHRRELKNSALHRLIIWQFTGRHIAERPLLGWGMETSRALPGGDVHYDLVDGGGYVTQMVSLSLHPHNAILQVWVELGAGGALISALLLAMSARWVTSLPRGDAALATGALITTLTIALLSFGIWQSWWDAELWLLAALLTAACEKDEGQA
jgi:exopolysaccharide production protein ExoQ